MLYTVKEIAALSNVTVKTLHHYHSIGLLLPCEISEAGYRLYGTKELERLQHILFYKELDFPLEKIKQLLEGAPDRLSILASQKELLLARKQRLERVIQTLDESISHAENGEQRGRLLLRDWLGLQCGQSHLLIYMFSVSRGKKRGRVIGQLIRLMT